MEQNKHDIKFLIYGEGWHGTTPHLLFEHLSSMGCRVSFFDYTKIMPGIRTRELHNRVLRRAFYNRYRAKIVDRLRSELNHIRPDVFVVAKGLDLDPEIISYARNAGATTVNWSPDDYENPHNSNSRLLESIPEYDIIISARQHRFDRYRELGAKTLYFWEWYFVESIHFPRHRQRRFEASFVGSWSPERERFLSSQPVSFSIWGGGWEKASRSFRTNNLVHPGVIDQNQMVDIFSSSRFNINMLTEQNFDQTNLRIFETTASEALLLTPRNETTQKYFDDGTHCFMYDDEKELSELLVGSALEGDIGEEQIRRNGRSRVLSLGASFRERSEDFLRYLMSHLEK